MNMKWLKWSRKVFWLAATGMFLCLASVLGLLIVAKSYSLMPPGDLWPGAVFLPFIAIVYGATEAFGTTSHFDELQLRVKRAWNFILWGNPLGWLGLVAFWLLKKSPGMCLIALLVVLFLRKNDKKVSS